MKARQFTPVSLLVASMFLSSCAHSQAQGIRGDIKEFVAQYVAALNAKDTVRLNSFLHPKSIACVTKDTKPYYDEGMAIHLRDPIPANYTYTLSPLDTKAPQPLEGYAQFPVRPSHQLQIEYDEGEDHGVVLVWLVQEKDRWLQDDPCATEQVLKQFRDDEPARKERVAKHKALVAAIQEPLRSELLALLREHKTVTATKRYQEASGENYETSMFVIYELTPEARQAPAS
jgi:hypothetical protein